ncbi:MAG: hypothetical protein G01um10143_542 [Parcubacteria group bacterium Gr01-1014_3]|nr:MAG: hypothetical protein G01um10143_542 [Parcubacteria group bacterium Gr01-1014_3]
MKHLAFKIEFSVIYHDGFAESLQDQKSRVIMALDIDQARRVAAAMRGEETLDAYEYLHEVLSVEPTTEEPSRNNPWDPMHTWKRLAHHLKLAPNEKIEPILYNGAQVGIEIVNK